MKDGEVARLLSLILRHEPERIGLTLDGQGWANVPDLIRLAKRAGKPFDLAILRRVVEMNDKRRFTLSPDGLRIRAAQGHSLPIDLDLPAVQPPDRLWHGTARDNLPSIFRDGLDIFGGNCRNPTVLCLTRLDIKCVPIVGMVETQKDDTLNEMVACLRA